MKLKFSVETYYLTEFAKKAIIAACENQLVFYKEIRKDAVSDELRTGIDHEINTMEAMIKYYSAFDLEAPSHES